MADEQVTTEPGPMRTETGTIVDQSPTQSSQSPLTTTPETTPETTPPPDGKTLLTEGEKEPPKPAEGAPEKYEDYKVPEGFTLDPVIKTQADAMFKSLGLNQEQAQSLVDFYTKQTSDAAQAPYKAWNEMTAEWRTQAESHPDLKGKLGPGQEINVRIGKFLAGLPDAKLASDFKQLMDLTGAGNHPAFIRVLDHAARLLTEGSHVAGNGAAPAGQSKPGTPPPSAAAAMWPNLPSSRG